MRPIDMNREQVLAFQALLARKAQAVEAARVSLDARVREFVEAHGRNGSKTGRPDYVTVVGLDEVERLRIALREYDRVAALPAQAFATSERKDEG